MNWQRSEATNLLHSAYSPLLVRVLEKAKSAPEVSHTALPGYSPLAPAGGLQTP